MDARKPPASAVSSPSFISFRKIRVSLSDRIPPHLSARLRRELSPALIPLHPSAAISLLVRRSPARLSPAANRPPISPAQSSLTAYPQSAEKSTRQIPLASPTPTSP